MYIKHVVAVSGLLFLIILVITNNFYNIHEHGLLLFPRKSPQNISATTTYFKSKLTLSNAPVNFTEEFSKNYTCENSPPYGDPESLTKCGLSANRWKLYNNLLWWRKFAAEFNLTWFLVYGSLLGQHRHKDIIHYDSDMDIGLLIEDEKTEKNLRKISTDRHTSVYQKPNLIFRPGNYCPVISGYHQRMNCKGEYQSYMQDACAFCGPMARIIFSHASSYIDVYKHVPYTINGDIMIMDEGMSEPEPKFNHHSWYFPLQPCIFMNLTVPCPIKPVKLMQSYHYGNLKPYWKCVNETWVST